MKLKSHKSKFTNSEKNKHLKLPSYTYNLEIYEVFITVIIGTKYLLKYNKLFNYESCNACCDNWLKDHSEIILFFRDKPKMSSISHECTHACDNILDYIGYKHTGKSNEVNAYLVGHLVDVVLKAKRRMK